jgi:transcriptional regulator with XRE-family HTH domain
MPRFVHPVKIHAAAHGWTLIEVASRIGVSEGTLALVVNGHRRPWPKIRRSLADLFGVPEATLFDTELEVAR